MGKGNDTQYGIQPGTVTTPVVEDRPEKHRSEWKEEMVPWFT